MVWTLDKSAVRAINDASDYRVSCRYFSNGACIIADTYRRAALSLKNIVRVRVSAAVRPARYGTRTVANERDP
eukprot:scaffold166132_cov17-Prasinocladus_malaysianus.AAC.1